MLGKEKEEEIGKEEELMVGQKMAISFMLFFYFRHHVPPTSHLSISHISSARSLHSLSSSLGTSVLPTS